MHWWAVIFQQVPSAGLLYDSKNRRTSTNTHTHTHAHAHTHTHTHSGSWRTLWGYNKTKTKRKNERKTGSRGALHLVLHSRRIRGSKQVQAVKHRHSGTVCLLTSHRQLEQRGTQSHRDTCYTSLTDTHTHTHTHTNHQPPRKTVATWTATLFATELWCTERTLVPCDTMRR